MPETTTAKERELRRIAAEPVLRRLEADSQRAPDLAPFLKTIETRLFDYDFDVTALWREHEVSKKAGEWFALLGWTPKAYLTDCRLSVAARLLAGTSLRVPRILALTGYASKAPFYKAFKTWSGGRTPLEYRRHPDPVHEPRRTEIDLDQVRAALDGRLSRKEGLILRRRINERLHRLFEPDFSELLALADAALATADYETALRHLERAAKHPERAGRGAELDSRIAVATHCRGAVLTLEGDVDRAYEDLALARGCYAQAGALEPGLERRRRRLELQVPCATDHALESALCPDCRRALVLDVGESLRGHLRRALELVPLDLPWFGVCCDGCYRVIWKAFNLARHGLLDDAYQAWWLAMHVDLGDSEAPASVGRVMAALAEVDSLSWSSQEHRLRMCDLARGAAEATRRPQLLLITRFWRGNVLRALARFADSRLELTYPGQGKDLQNQWIRALRYRFLGLLEQATNDFQEALSLLEAAAELYRTLDPHLAGLLLNQKGRVHVDTHEYETAIRLYRESLSVVDSRRSSEPVAVGIAINLARALVGAGNTEQAKHQLAHLQYDRSRFPHLAAVEAFAHGCISLLAGQAGEACRFFLDAHRQFEALGEWVYAALCVTYSVEGHFVLGESREAATAARAAARLLAAAGCPTASLEAMARLETLVAATTRQSEVASAVRALASRCGGWLQDSTES